MARIPPENAVEVDMVPLIDIVVLILLFLIITGDMARSATNVPMKLPRADQAKAEKDMNIKTEGRIVVQMTQKENRWWAVVEKSRYELMQRGDNPNLVNFLNELIARRKVVKGPSGEVDFPVKLRIPADAPMREVEKVIMTCARSGLVNIHYAADKSGSQ